MTLHRLQKHTQYKVLNGNCRFINKEMRQRVQKSCCWLLRGKNVLKLRNEWSVFLPHCCSLGKKIIGDDLFNMRTYCLVFCLWSLCDTIPCLHACQPYWILLIGDEILLFQFETQMWPFHLLLLCVHFASRGEVHTPGVSQHLAPKRLCKILWIENARFLFLRISWLYKYSQIIVPFTFLLYLISSLKCLGWE